jgi:S-adenosylmethionine hydrolase
MADPIITLTTDFGEDSPYVAAMKGVILGINPAARLVDLSHQIPPQDVRHAACFLAESIPYFPPGVIHVVVVDPGVGSERSLLYAEIDGQRMLAPDNGCWTMLRGTPTVVIRLTERKYWREAISNTFHGRDILAPVAGHLSLGVDALNLGPQVHDWVQLQRAEARPGMNSWIGEVVRIDRFGNLITNISGSVISSPPCILQVGSQSRRKFRWVHSYAEAAPGTLVALVSSSGMLEVAVTNGSAANRLRAKVGTPVVVGRE